MHVGTTSKGCIMGSLDYAQGESSKELLEAQSHLWNHTFRFINSMALKCAIELGIPDIIHKHNQPITLSDLSSALLIPPSRTPHLRRLMSLLAHSKFFTEEEGEEEESVFSLTTVSEILVKERRTSLSPFVLLMLDPRLLKPWHSLGNWFTREEPLTAFELAHGTPIWDVFGQVAEFNEMFNEGMSSDAGFTAEVIVRDCGEVFRGLGSLVDVGGGTGTLARAIAGAFPSVLCTVLDLPRVVEGLKESTGVHFVGGDMFDSVPPADATLLKWVLHDWSDQECVKILKRCKEAIPPKKAGGKVIIIDMVVNTSEANHEFAETQFLFDLHMMAHTTGKQRTEEEWKKIFTDAGFRDYKILPILGLRSVIEVYY